jgi:hypothetical protein
VRAEAWNEGKNDSAGAALPALETILAGYGNHPVAKTDAKKVEREKFNEKCLAESG